MSDIKNYTNIQDSQLAEWKELLNEEVYTALVIYAKKDIDKVDEAFEIKRGVTLSNFIQNYLMYKRTGRLENELGKEGFRELLNKVINK